MSKRALDLNAQVAELGREAAREAWNEADARLEHCPGQPKGPAWAHVAFMAGLLECDRLFIELEWRVFAHAYRSELHALAAEQALRPARGQLKRLTTACGMLPLASRPPAR